MVTACIVVLSVAFGTYVIAGVMAEIWARVVEADVAHDADAAFVVAVSHLPECIVESIV